MADVRRASQAAFDRWEQFACSQTGLVLIFGWSFAEATVWPVIADALLLPVAVVNRRRWWATTGAAIAGIAIGGTAWFVYASGYPEAAQAVVRALGVATDGQIETARARLAADGAAAFLAQPWSGIPFKAWAIAGGFLQIDPWIVIPISSAARAARMLGTAVIGRIVARLAGTLVRDRFLPIAFTYVVVVGGISWRLQG